MACVTSSECPPWTRTPPRGGAAHRPQRARRATPKVAPGVTEAPISEPDLRAPETRRRVAHQPGIVRSGTPTNLLLVSPILAPIDFEPLTPQLFHPGRTTPSHLGDPVHYLIENGYTESTTSQPTDSRPSVNRRPLDTRTLPTPHHRDRLARPPPLDVGIGGLATAGGIGVPLPQERSTTSPPPRSCSPTESCCASTPTTTPRPVLGDRGRRRQTSGSPPASSSTSTSWATWCSPRCSALGVRGTSRGRCADRGSAGCVACTDFRVC